MVSTRQIFTNLFIFLNMELFVVSQVTEAMTEEIGRLGLLVNEFDHPFHPHPGFLKTYKKVMLNFVTVKKKEDENIGLGKHQ